MIKSKTVSNGDLVIIRANKICKLRKDSNSPAGIYCSKQKETIMLMNGVIKEIETPEHIKLRGTFVVRG